MGVHIDEARCNNETMGKYDPIAFQRLFRDAGYFISADTNIADRVQPRLRINHPPAFDYDVKSLAWPTQRAAAKCVREQHRDEWSRYGM